MHEEEQAMERAVARLDERQRTVVRACLEAAVHGTHVDRVTRSYLRETLEAWPASVDRADSFGQVDGVLTALFDSLPPHQRWRDLERYVDTTQEEVDLALVAWRDLGWTAGGAERGLVDEHTMTRAVARLDEAQRTFVLKCLVVGTYGPYFDDEFHTVIGAWRHEAAATIAAWPEPAEHGRSFVVVNNVLNNLIGYPHRMWDVLERETAATENDLERALLAWRGQADRTPGGQGDFDSFM